MLKSLVLDCFFIFVILRILSKAYTNSTFPYLTPITSYGISSFNYSYRLEYSHWIGILMWGGIIFLISCFFGISIIFLRNLLTPPVTFLEVILIFLTPDLVRYGEMLIPSFPYIPSSKIQLTDFAYLFIFIECTLPQIIGGLIVWN